MQIPANHQSKFLSVAPSARVTSSPNRHSILTQYLIDQGKSAVCASQEAHAYPLHFAVYNGYNQLIDQLLAAPSTQINLMDNSGNTPVMIAALHADISIIKRLIDAGAELEQAGQHGSAVLAIVAARGNLEIIRVVADALPVTALEHFMRTRTLYSANSRTLALLNSLIAEKHQRLGERAEQTVSSYTMSMRR